MMITFVNLKAANLGDALRCVQEQTSRTRFPIHDDGNSAKDLAFLSEFRKQWHVRSLSFRGPVSCAQLSREGFPGGLRLWVVVTSGVVRVQVGHGKKIHCMSIYTTPGEE